ncbi:MAG: hypothetical protein ACHBN1_17325 [Heteroscytonema crispum UTEX LB 1556]
MGVSTPGALCRGTLSPVTCSGKPSRSAGSPPHWRTMSDCRACFADSKELPWFPRRHSDP